MTRRRWLSLLLVLVAVAGACGQKSGVAGRGSDGSGGGGTNVAAGTGESNGASGAGTTGGVTGVTAVNGGGGAAGAAGGTSSGGGTSSAGGGGGGGGAASSGTKTVAGDRTGITNDTITIGLHAPLTGAAPVPQQSFQTGLPIYWNWINSQGGVFGRKVKIVFRDDEFDPSAAVRVCREMVEQDRVFLLIGAAGADQITACAKYATSAGVPYMSPGVNEQGLSTLRGYFAGSMTYPQQNPMLGQLAKKTTKSGKVAIVIEDTPTFRESHNSAVQAMKDNGLNITYDKYITKGASQAEILTTASNLKGSGADIVYFLGPPTTFIPLAQQGLSQGYQPTYIGPGLSNGLNLVATAGCPGIANAMFLSPFPELDVIDKLDPNFRAQYSQQTGNQPDDLGLALWGINKTIHQYFLAAGKDMTRQSLVAALEGGKVFESNVLPKAQYSAKNHFGATSAHLLKADCNSRTFTTAAQFVTGF